MTDHPDTPGQDDPDSTSHDVELSADELEELTGRLRDVPAPAASVRAAQIAAALDVFDDLSPALPRGSEAPLLAPVTSISSAQRRRQQMYRRSAIAAAVVLVVGVGVGLAARSGGGSDDMASDAASAPASKAGDQLTSGAEATSDAAAPMPANAAAGSQELASPPSVLQLGEQANDDALRYALAAGRRAERAAAAGDTAEMAPDETSGMAAGGSDDPVTTAAGSSGSGGSSCSASRPAGAVVIAEATLGGRPVIVLEVPDPSAAPPTRTVVVDLADCSSRQL